MSQKLVQFGLVLSVAFTLLGGSAAHACEGACPLKKPAEEKQASEKDPLAPVDHLLADKCDCGGKGDCTCKHGACKCGKCSRHRSKVVPSLREADVQLPREARYDASAGVFI